MELATPAKFDVYDEPNNVAHHWERYVKSVKVYLAAKGLTLPHHNEQSYFTVLAATFTILLKTTLRTREQTLQL